MNRKKGHWVLFSFVTVIVLSLIFCMGQTTQAVDAKALLKQINQELRLAEWVPPLETAITSDPQP